jgi:hypothetical protein
MRCLIEESKHLLKQSLLLSFFGQAYFGSLPLSGLDFASTFYNSSDHGDAQKLA